MHGKPKTNSAGVACYSLCQTSGLVNVIAGNTFLQNKGNAESTLDLVLTDNPALVSKVSLENAVGASAHCRIVTVLKLFPKSCKTYTKVGWKYHLANWPAMCETLKNADWSDTADVNQKWTLIKNNITQAMNSFIPKSIIKRSINSSSQLCEALLRYSCRLVVSRNRMALLF